MEQRLQRILAAAGLASRRAAEAWIRAGRVQVNGRVARLGERANPQRDRILVDGELLSLRAEPLQYWLLHKPRGVLSTTRDPHARPSGRRTVLELLPRAARKSRLYPVGRLDLDSEGLLLLTNDGATALVLMHPTFGAERVYRVTVAGALSSETARRLARGPMLEDGPMARCAVGPRRFDARHSTTTFTLTLKEGRKRQIRRALRALGHPVRRLLRTRHGALSLGRLPSGAARELRAPERERLLAQVRRKEKRVEQGKSI